MKVLNEFQPPAKAVITNSHGDLWLKIERNRIADFRLKKTKQNLFKEPMAIDYARL